MSIKGVEEIEGIVREFKKREVDRKYRRMIGSFKIISIELKEELGSRVYEVICEYGMFPPHPSGLKRQVVTVRAVSGEIISFRDV